MKSVFGKFTSVLVLGLVLPFVAAGGAHGEGRVFWVDTVADKLLSVDTAGVGPVTELPSTDVPPSSSYSLAYSPDQDRFYFPLSDGAAPGFENRIGWTSGDGSGDGGLLDTDPLAPDDPNDVAVDSISGRIWWSNSDGPGIMSADQSGGNATTFLTSGGSSRSLALDSIDGELYWSYFDDFIHVPIDGSEPPAGLDIGAASSELPLGLAIDRRDGRLYWANWASQDPADAIGWADTGGGGGDNLDVGDLDFRMPTGVIIDPSANRIYWLAARDGEGNRETALFWRDRDDNGIQGRIGGLGTAYQPSSPILINAPEATAVPMVAGSGDTGAELSCEGAEWDEADHPEARSFVSPVATTLRWERDGQAIPGADGSTITATEPGEYRCVETAKNPGGETEVVSAVHLVSGTGPTGPTLPIGPTGPTGPETVCPAIKLNLRSNGFGPRKPRRLRSSVPGVRAKMKTGSDVMAKFRPRIRYRTRNGKVRTAKLRQRTVRIRGSRKFRFILPNKVRRQLRHPIVGRRVTLAVKAWLRLRTADTDCVQGPLTTRSRTKVVRISKKVGLR